MITKEYKLEGWVKKTKQDIYFQKCPCCGELRVGLTVINGTDVECPKCNKCYPYKGNSIKLTKDALECHCGEIVPLITNYKSDIEYECHKCLNILAVEYEDVIYKPKEILNPKWLKNEIKSAKNIYNDIYAINSDDNRSLVAFKVIHRRIAVREGDCFINFNSNTQKGILFFDKQNIEYIGCIVWSEDEEKQMNVLRQIIVFKDKRRKGYGTQMLNYWINTYGFDKYPSFGVESPNPITYKLLEKLKYVKYENGKIIRIGWHSVRGL